MRPTNRVGQEPNLWLLLFLRLRKCFKLRYLLFIFLILLLATYLRIIRNAPTDQLINNESNSPTQIETKLANYPHKTKCNFHDTETILHYTPLNKDSIDDNRPKPTIERLNKLFQLLISHEDKYRKLFDYLNIFRFTDIFNTLQPYANNTEQLNNIYCLFQRYITISDNGHIDITPELIFYLKQVSNYLSDGFKSQHDNWNIPSINNQIKKPVIILAANSHFYDTLQASMKTVNQHLGDFPIAIYDLGFNSHQLIMIKENCVRCIIIPFPYGEIEPVAGHIRNLGNFAWKPIMVQVKTFIFIFE